MYKINLKEDILLNFKCQKENHLRKKIDFICQKKDCTDRFICSICLLQEHYSHFSEIILIETFFDKINENQQQELGNILMLNANDVINDNNNQIEIAQINLKKAIENAKQHFDNLQIQFDITKETIIANIKESSKIQNEKYQEQIKDINQQIEQQSLNENKINIDTFDDIKTYIDNFFSKNDNQELNIKQIQKSILKINQIKSVQIKVDESKIAQIKKTLQQLQNQCNNYEILEYFSNSDEFISHRYMIQSNLSTFDHMKLKCDRVIQTNHKKPIYKLLFLENDTKFVTASEDSTINIWMTASGQLLKTLTGHTDRIWNLIELADGRLASGSSDNKIRIWNLKTYTCDAVLVGHTGFVCAIMGYQDNIISGSQDKTLKFWNISQQKCTKTYKEYQQGKIMCVIMVNNEELCCGSDSQINIYDIESGKIQKVLSGHTALIRHLLLLDNLDTLLSSSDDWTIRMWSLSSQNCVRVFKGHKHSANYLLNFKQDIFLSVSDDSSIKLWDLNKEDEEISLVGHTSWVITANIMKNGTIVSSGADKSVRFWNES